MAGAVRELCGPPAAPSTYHLADAGVTSHPSPFIVSQYLMTIAFRFALSKRRLLIGLYFVCCLITFVLLSLTKVFLIYINNMMRTVNT